ncbi:MAG: dCTP deaminase [Nitrospirota bacterium]|nr:dCTP deaminase [Nitrospirota bacterium]
MTILARSEILHEIANGRIRVSPYDESLVGPASIDLHLSNVFRVFRYMKENVRVDVNADFKQATRGIRVKEGETLLLKPGETVLGITTEKIELPDDICGWLEGRSRFARLGLLVHISASFMQPGLSNHQVLEMSNFGPAPLDICPGTPICQFIFQRTTGHGTYEGRFREQTPERFLHDD